MPQTLTIVWDLLTCEWLENNTVVYNREQAKNADMGANDPRTNGPWRGQKWQQPPLPEIQTEPETFLYLGEPYETEALAMAAWQAVMDAELPEDGLPENPPMPPAIPPAE